MPLDRREFLKRGAVLVAAGLAVPTFVAETARVLGSPDLSRKIAAASPLLGNRLAGQLGEVRAPADLSKRTLVVIQLAGGNDGINTLIPYGDPLYYQARPTLAVPKDQVLALDGNVGLSSYLKLLKGRFDAGQLAVVQGVGYPNPNRSHFRAMDIWQTATPDRIEPTGWLGRYLQSCACEMDSHLEAVVMGPTVQKSFWTELTLVPAIANLAAFQYGSPRANPTARNYEVQALRSALAQTRGRPEEEFLRQATSTALDDADVLARVASQYQPSVAYPQTYFGESLKTIAQIIAGEVGTRVYFATLGGFDTHAAQATTQQRLLTDLDTSLDAFLQDLERLGKLDDVLVMTFSEFGRRVGENGSNGTDHGTAEPLFVLGGAVKGGLHGAYPSMADLDQGDLKFTTDFRSVYGTVLEGWMGVPSNEILGGTFPALSLVA
ncbi:MAG: DUF1501 domain-containing protein [Chloroflexi bacterium]|nr:DUF1501 domain-containing protein [Chloroflexota bacterium]